MVCILKKSLIRFHLSLLEGIVHVFSLVLDGFHLDYHPSYAAERRRVCIIAKTGLNMLVGLLVPPY